MGTAASAGTRAGADTGAGADSGAGATGSRVTRWWAAVRRGFGHAGPERETMFLVLKSTLAASVAWVLAENVLQASSATFAPFSALLMVQVTIAHSLFQSVRYAAAVIAGVALTAALVPLFGATVAAFAVLMLAGLLVGRWRRLGSQGSQVAVAALFAYASFTSGSSPGDSLAQLGSIAGLVVMGSAIGVLVNLVLAPPIRFRSGAYAVNTLSGTICDLLTDMATGLGRGVPGEDEVHEWSSRAERLPGLAEQARESIERAAESMRFNPRRLITRVDADFSGYRITVCGFERAGEQIISICRGLRHTKSEDRDTLDAEHRFAALLSEIVDAASEATRVLGSLHSVTDLSRVSELDEPLERGRDAVHRASDQADEQGLDHGYDGPIYTGLLTDLRRLIEEFGEARGSLAADGPDAPVGESEEGSGDDQGNEPQNGSDAGSDAAGSRAATTEQA